MKPGKRYLLTDIAAVFNARPIRLSNLFSFRTNNARAITLLRLAVKFCLVAAVFNVLIFTSVFALWLYAAHYAYFSH